MTNIEQKARELLAAEFERSGRPDIAVDVRRGHAEGHCTPLWMDEALRAIQSALTAAGEREANPCEKIFDHKWLDPICVEGGCRSLLLENALKAYLKAQRQMAEKWAEVDDAKKNELWRALHACEAAAEHAIEAGTHLSSLSGDEGGQS